MAKKPQIPLKDVMAAIDKKDRNFYNRLNDDQRKAFSAWMMMRYCSSVQGRDAANYIYLTNELVNFQFMEVSKHPELQWLLLSACGTGKIQFHPYLKPPNAKKKKNKVSEFLYGLYPHSKPEDIELMIKLNTNEELKALAYDYGYDDKTIKDIFGK
jgi:hypothetical protein|tara:strand:- start:2986 stop:3453 length:468 start_codon:yes stop_codon:yes gene_type:complete